jgi:hypothetical protein
MSTPSADSVRSSLFAAIKANVTDDVVADISAAVRKIDPATQIARTGPGNVLVVETSASADTLRDAIQNSGYIAEVSAARPRSERPLCSSIRFAARPAMPAAAPWELSPSRSARFRWELRWDWLSVSGAGCAEICVRVTSIFNLVRHRRAD